MKANTKLPGLDVRFSQSCGSLYADIIHLKSGQFVVTINHPLNCGKKEFCKRVDDTLNSFDWERDVEIIGNDMECYKAVQNLRNETTTTNT